MAKYSATLSAQNTNTILFTAHKPRNGSVSSLFTVLVSGTFGGGTVTVNISPDKGTTLVPLVPIGTSAPTITAAMAFTYQVGNGDKLADSPDIYVSIGAATTPTINIVAYDNN